MYTDAPTTTTGAQAPMNNQTGNQTKQEEVSPCCNAPFYAKTVRIGEDGRVTPDGKPTPVRSCMACGANYPKAPFVIDSEEKANWLLSKLAAIRAEQKRIKAQTATRMEELDADYNKLAGRFSQQLEAFAREESEKRRRKTVTLQQGTLSFRSIPAKLVIEDQQTATTTAKAVCPSAIVTETTEKLDTAAFLARATEIMTENGGEILPGLKLTEAKESFSVKIPD